jgi:hypothetical protein
MQIDLIWRPIDRSGAFSTTSQPNETGTHIA